MNIKNLHVDVIHADMLELDVDAIVNPAAMDLSMKSGLAGAIKSRAGLVVEEEALLKGPLSPGDAVATSGGHLKAKHVIHAVTTDQRRVTDQIILRRAVAEALKCAVTLDLTSLALPAMGCGSGGFPAVGAAKIITQEIFRFVRNADNSLRRLTICLNDKELYRIFQKTIQGYVRHVQDTLGPGPYVTVDILIEMPEGLILIERSNPPFGWALPGGFLDYGESLEDGARREAKEETNLDLVDLRQMHTYSDPTRDPRFHTISTVFIAQGQGTPQFGDDAKGLKVVPYEDLLSLEYAFDHKQVVKDYLVNR